MQKYLVLYMLDYAKLIEWAKVDVGAKFNVPALASIFIFPIRV